MLWMLNEETHKHSKSKAKTQHKPTHNKVLVTNNLAPTLFIKESQINKMQLINDPLLLIMQLILKFAR